MSHTCLCCFKSSPLSAWSSSKPPGHWQGFFPGIFYSNSCIALSGLPLPLGSPVLNCQWEHSFINQNFIKDLRRRKKEKSYSDLWPTEACLLFNNFKPPPNCSYDSSFPTCFLFSLLSVPLSPLWQVFNVQRDQVQTNVTLAVSS